MVLVQVQRWHPQTKLLLRIRADDTQARCQLGNKFGADPVDALGELLAAEGCCFKAASRPAQRKSNVLCMHEGTGMYILKLALC